MLKSIVMLILASNSPRRKQLLSLGGWKFSVLAPQVDETVRPREEPEAYVYRLAQEKVAAARRMLEEGCHPRSDADHALILAADTAVIDQDENGEWKDILGKPADSSQAEAMLLRLRGRTHRVYTGLALMRTSDCYLLGEVVTSEVPMRSYSLEEIRTYIASGDPLDKAGAYGIQHPVFRPVQNLQGCYANVMGLPICHAARLLRKMDCPPIGDLVDACQGALDHPCTVSLQAWHADRL